MIELIFPLGPNPPGVQFYLNLINNHEIPKLARHFAECFPRSVKIWSKQCERDERKTTSLPCLTVCVRAYFVSLCACTGIEKLDNLDVSPPDGSAVLMIERCSQILGVVYLFKLGIFVYRQVRQNAG